MALQFVNPPATKQFYSTFPSYGKNIAFQWDELREDLRMLNPIVRATLYENDTTQPFQDSAVTAREFGEFDFHNRYRIYWDKSLSELQIQKNIGTEAAPIWTIHASFGQAPDGTLIIKDAKGFVSEVGETGAGGDTSFYNVNRLLFDVGSGFYLTSSRDGDPVVNFTQLFGRADSFTQSARAVEWQIAHNFGTTKLQVQVFDDNNKIIPFTSERVSRFDQITKSAEWTVSHSLGTREVYCEAYDTDGGVRLTDQPHLKRIVVQDANTVNFYFDQARSGFSLIQGICPGIDSIDISDKNTAYFYFNTARKGSVMISSGAQGAKELLTAVTFSDGINSHTSTQLNFANADFYLSTNATGQPVVNSKSVKTTGDIMTGNLTITDGGIDVTGSSTITGDLAVSDVITAEAFYVKSKGDVATLTGTETLTNKTLTSPVIDMGSNRITSLGAPTADSDAARLQDINKFYGVLFKLSDNSFAEKDDTLVFNSSDFSMTQDAQGKPRVSVTAAAGTSITIAESDGGGSFTDNTFKVDSAYFYMQGGASNPIISLHGIPFRVRMSSLAQDFSDIDILTVLAADFYLTQGSDPREVILNSKASGGGQTAPGGNDTEIQYNNNGSFGGDSKLVWIDTLGSQQIRIDHDSLTSADPLIAPANSVTTGFGFGTTGVTTPSMIHSGSIIFSVNSSAAIPSKPIWGTNASEANPGYTFINDATSGMFRAGAGQVGFSIVGEEIQRWHRSGTDRWITLAADAGHRIGIGTAFGTKPDEKLHVQGGGLFENGSVKGAGFYLLVDSGPSELVPGIIVEEADGAPSISKVERLVVSNSTLTDDGIVNGRQQATLTSGGGTITFEESEAGGLSVAKDTLVFDSSVFYLSIQGTSGNVIVSQVSPGQATSFTFGSATEWQVGHNFGNQNILWCAYDDSQRALIPATVDISDVNTAYFYFAEPTAGRAVILG